jgi:phosphoribosylanthranilate isomerase
MIIQIYEIQTPDEARLMVDLGVDHVGSVLISDRPWKNPALRSAIEVVQSSGRKSSLIPLFGHVDTIAAAVDYYRPDILHFCEILTQPADHREAPRHILERQREVRNQFPGLEIMRSIPIGIPGRADRVPSLLLAELFEPFSDWLLIDTVLGEGVAIAQQEQPVNGYVGITGRACDWRVARDLVQKSRIPVILAGGIGPGNVAAGIAQIAPAGVDSCTLTNKVASNGKVIRFQKDPDKVNAMIQSAQRAAILGEKCAGQAPRSWNHP